MKPSLPVSRLNGSQCKLRIAEKASEHTLKRGRCHLRPVQKSANRKWRTGAVRTIDMKIRKTERTKRIRNLFSTVFAVNIIDNCLPYLLLLDNASDITDSA